MASTILCVCVCVCLFDKIWIARHFSEHIFENFDHYFSSVKNLTLLKLRFPKKIYWNYPYPWGILSLINQFVIFKPLSYCFEETIGFDVKASFASRSTGFFMDWKLQTEMDNNSIENSCHPSRQNGRISWEKGWCWTHPWKRKCAKKMKTREDMLTIKSSS